MKSLLLVGFLYLTILNALASNSAQKNAAGQVHYVSRINETEFVQPWKDATVRLVKASDNREVARTKTNELGIFAFKNVQAGRYVAITSCGANLRESRSQIVVGNSNVDATFLASPLRCPN